MENQGSMYLMLYLFECIYKVMQTLVDVMLVKKRFKKVYYLCVILHTKIKYYYLRESNISKETTLFNNFNSKIVCCK